MKVMMIQNVFEDNGICGKRIILEKGNVYNLKFINATLPIDLPENIYIEVCCKTCKFYDLDGDYCRCEKNDKWEWKGANEMKMPTENKMPELKPGMVGKYRGTLHFVSKALDGTIYSPMGNDGCWASSLSSSLRDIDEVYNVKRPVMIDEIFKSRNLELIWERKPDTDWTKVAVDTPILVRDIVSDPWEKRHFAKVDKNNRVITFANGRTSFSDDGVKSEWNYAVLYEGNEHLVGDK